MAQMSRPSHIDWPCTALAIWFEFKSIMVIDNLYQDGLLKGVLHPRPVFGLFLQFFSKTTTYW